MKLRDFGGGLLTHLWILCVCVFDRLGSIKKNLVLEERKNFRNKRNCEKERVRDNWEIRGKVKGVPPLAFISGR